MTPQAGDRQAGDRRAPDGALRLGRLGRTHGLDGALRLHLDTIPVEHAAAAVRAGETVHVDGHGPLQLRDARPHGRGLLVAFQGVRSPERAQSLVNAEVYVEPDRLGEEAVAALRDEPLEGALVSVDGTAYGRVVSVVRGAQRLVLVRTDADGVERWLPLDASYVRLATGRIDVVDPPPGLLDDEA